MNLKVLDLFCGTGGFSYGLERGGPFETVLGIDILQVSTSTFARNHRGALAMTGDLRTMRRTYIAERTNLKRGSVSVIVGGPPCQGFSSIRPFRSTNDDDPRNSLFEEFASFVNYFRPPVFVLENVIGLATHKNGSTIEQMQECFAALGYDVEWRILNAAHFGVPQKRERLIMIGCERGGRIVFPEPTHQSTSPTIGYRYNKKLQRPEATLFSESERLPQAVNVIEAIGDLPPVNSGERCTEYKSSANNAYQLERRNGAQHLTLHSSTAHTPKMLEIIRHSGKNISCVPTHLISSGFSSSYSRLDADDPSVTITVNFVHPASNRCIHPVQDRALTPREGARIQSFDDTFEFSGNRSQIVKQIGNAVPPVLGKVLGEAIKSMLI